MPATAQIVTIKRGRKFEQVLEGARTVFLRDGFEGASVDDIAAEAGVSKATLYSYFPDKRILFIEVDKQESKRQADEAEVLVTLTAPPDCVLPEAARRIIAFTLSDLGQAVFRLCVAESDRFPELGREFYASGPALARDRLATYLNGAVARGELVIDDVYLAADQFASLCKAGIFLAVSFGVQRAYTATERERVAKGAVEMFLARYGAKARAPA